MDFIKKIDKNLGIKIMATFNELAVGYLKRLQNTSDVSAEARRIIAEINGLVYSNTNNELSRADKLRIVEHLESLAVLKKKVDSIVLNEDFSVREESENFSQVNASDNSGILEVITKLKGGV